MMTEAGPSSQGRNAAGSSQRRVTKACEACRQRRRRCDGQRPCSTCVRARSGDSCHFRVKARPNGELDPTAHLKRVDIAQYCHSSFIRANSSEQPESRTNPIIQIADTLSQWANEKGLVVDLTLPPDTALTALLFEPEPDLPGDRACWQELFNTFLIMFEHHQKLLLRGQAGDLFDKFLHEPGHLPPDEMALVLAVLALGRQAETRLRGLDAPDIREESAFFRLALSAIEGNETVTPTGIRALHLLHLFALFNGGPSEVTYFLDIVTHHCRQLGAHRRSTASSASPHEEVGRLFYLSMYKDTWFTTLYPSKELAFPLGDFEHTWVEKQEQGNPSMYEEDPLFVELTLLETEAIKMLQAGPISGEELLELETRLASWQVDLRACEGRKAVMSGYATIRFQWLRLLLRIPWLIGGKQVMASLAILSVSSASILRCYDRFSGTRYFRPMWAETRRITTAAYVLMYCFIRGEVSAIEFEPLATTATTLLQRLAKGHAAAAHVLEAWTSLRRLVNSISPSPSAAPDATNPQQSDFTPFDYTLPAEQSLW